MYAVYIHKGTAEHGYLVLSSKGWSLTALSDRATAFTSMASAKGQLDITAWHGQVAVDRTDAIPGQLTGYVCHYLGPSQRPVQVTVTVTNNNPNTIWNRLKAQLGREPTEAEAAAEVKRIIHDAKE